MKGCIQESSRVAFLSDKRKRGGDRWGWSPMKTSATSDGYSFETKRPELGHGGRHGPHVAVSPLASVSLYRTIANNTTTFEV